MKHILPSLYIVAVLIVFPAGSAFSPENVQAASKKDFNIVLITIDTLRADHLSCYGYERETSPHMDKIAEEGILFKNVIAPSSWTAPSMVSLFTSTYPVNHGVVYGLQWKRKNKYSQDAFSEKLTTLPEILKTHGYTTFGVSSNHNLTADLGFARGFHYFEYAGNANPADCVNKIVSSWEDKIKGVKKFFLWVHYMDPHHPYHDRFPWIAQYSSPSLTRTLNFTDKSSRELNRLIPTFKENPQHLSNLIALYDSEINYVDSHVGELIQKFELEKNTLLIIASDHGEEFLEHAWEWKEKHGGIILEQLKKLGASCDWDRTRFTMDEVLYESVIDVFIDLYEKGLIYRGIRMVNWDPLAKTAVSDEEVNYKEVKSKLYYLKYKVEGEDDFITIATTRPETILGDTAVCVHPEDERYQFLHGKKVRVPLCDRIVPVIQDEYVTMDFGTGCLKITPAHDENDYEIGRKYDLELVDIFNPDGTLNAYGLHYEGMDRFEARKAIAAELEEKGFLVKKEPYTHKVGTSERTKAVIEPRLSDENISVSHSGKFAAVITSKRNKVGIDIEQVHPRLHKVAEKFMSPEEGINESSVLTTDHLCLHWLEFVIFSSKGNKFGGTYRGKICRV